MFTLISYRQDHTDSVKGCVMGQTDSDIQIDWFKDKNDLINKWSEYLVFNKNTGYDYADYEFLLLEDGISIYCNVDGVYPMCEQIGDSDLGYAIQHLAAIESNKTQAQKEKEKQEKIARQKELDERATTAREILERDRLLKKHPIN